MTSRWAARVAMPLACAWLAACSTTTVIGDKPKEVLGFDMTPWSVQWECLELDVGDRLDYDFTANYPVNFFINYYDGNAEILPVSSRNVMKDGGRFEPVLAKRYCLTWESGPKGALLDYRIALRRAANP